MKETITDKQLDKFKYEVIRSNRRSFSIEIKSDLQVLVRAPLRMSDRQIKHFVKEKSDWIEKSIEKVTARKLESESRPKSKPYTRQEINELAKHAMEIIIERVNYYAPVVGVDFHRITIRCQRTRWGSCSSKGNLNFNCLLMKTPDEVIDYVVVHELCHRLEMNHSKRFWNEVERVYPDYRHARKWLKDNGGEIIDRVEH